MKASRTIAASVRRLLLAAAVTSAGVARAGGPGPAYFVEPGDAPRPSTEAEPKAAPPPAAAPPEGGAATTGVVDPEAILNAPLETFDPANEGPAEAVTGAVEAAEGAAEATPPPAPQVADDDARALTEFGTRLSPYGTWIEDPSYGTVWVPDASIVGADFAPYLTNGRWAIDAGGAQAWMSDYPFGDVVFHYGRWVWTASGWAWIPGYRYAPAWVAWRLPTDAYAYVGWSPLPPSFVWMRGAPMGLAWHGAYYWIFCPSSFVETSTPGLYVVRTAADARSLARHTRIVLPAMPRRGTPAGTVTRVPHSAGTPGARPAANHLPARGVRVAGAPASPVPPHAAAPARGGRAPSRPPSARSGPHR